MKSSLKMRRKQNLSSFGAAINEVLQALRYFEEGKHKGKIVITMDN